eukprot:TRINITY_DN31536_c0_g1_i1.p1 TRINITY_DN31536_c0_g1~~TRINITY_DN31536_c0_g1_i1.p1  ORF type:complete len:206 (-),score=36.74 TRINITY_DN31536_c0_g1_i1:111-728(-)
MSIHLPSAPQDLEFDRITMGSEPPPYSEGMRNSSSSVSLRGTRLSLDTQDEIGRRKKQKNVRRKTRCFKCLAGFFFCFILILSITGILYNAVLNIKLEKTNSNLGKLKEHIENQQEELIEVSGALKMMSEKLEVVEKDLENVKGVKKDIEFINEVKEQMKAYTNKFDSVKTLSSGTCHNSDRLIEVVGFLAFLHSFVLPKMIAVM